MARRAPEQTLRRNLRRYALSGNMQAAEALLLQHLKQHPQDTDAQCELERLRKGLPLLATETAAQRRKRESREACNRIFDLISAHPENTLNTTPTIQLAEMNKTLRSSMKAMDNRQLPALQSYHTSLRRELRRRGRSKLRRLMLILAGSASIIALLGGVGSLTYRRACSLEEELSKALRTDTTERIQSILPIANTGINRMLSPRLEETVKTANLHIASISNLRKRLEKHIVRIESGRGTIAAMRLSLRAEIENNLNSRPEEFEQLRKRWGVLCQREHAQLDEQRARLLQRLVAPLPPLPAFTGIPEQDIAALHTIRTEITRRELLYRQAPASFKLSPRILTPVTECRQHLDTILKEIAGYQDFLRRLTRIRSYEQYRAAIQAFTPSHYTPVAELMQIRTKLPAVENVKSLMQDPEHKIDDTESAAAMETLLKQGPTFTPPFPATQTQVVLMDNLFTAPSLHRVIYEVTNSAGEVCYTESRPTIDNRNRVHIKRSDLDPASTPDNRNICWDDATATWIRTLDARPLLKAANLEKASFFRDSNIPILLTQVINLDSPSCPALAQACVYHHLLLLLSLHEHRLLTGARYSPTLRRHAISFRKLKQRLNIELRPGCWLGRTRELQEAESAFAAWFRANRGGNYFREIRKNFSSLMDVGVDFSGYVNETGKATIFRGLSPETTIWYLCGDGLTAAPLSEQAEGAIPFSPIFTARRN